MPAKRDFAPEDVWRLRTVADPRLSPDGRLVAYVVSEPDRERDGPATTVWVAPVDGSAPARRFSAPGPTTARRAGRPTGGRSPSSPTGATVPSCTWRPWTAASRRC